LYALCHPNHPASIRVLEKCGFVLEDLLARFAEFPNLASGQREDCLRYAQAAVDSKREDHSCLVAQRLDIREIAEQCRRAYP
jgi:hypothetical protein